MAVTEGHLLGGRILYRQPARGFRSGLEPVLLAASVPARPGQRVIEAGTGAGAALLCLAARVPGIAGTGVEIDAPLAALAAENAAANGFDGIRIISAAIEDTAFTDAFDHAMANPPYHPPDGSVSPLAARDRAKRGSSELVDAWVGRLSAVLRPKGTLTLVIASGMIPACAASMQRHACACSAIYPLWPKAGRDAKLALLRGIKLGRSPTRLMAGLVLHEADGSFTETARQVIEAGAALPFGYATPLRGRRPPL